MRMCLQAFRRYVFPLVLLMAASAAWSANIEAELAQLSRHPDWHNLLHYRTTWVGFSKQSQADDPRFFITAEGRNSPGAELVAFWNALQGPSAQMIRCRFPARYAWLRQHYPSRLPELSARDCPQLTNWLEDINAHSVTFVYVSSSLGHSSSLFGQAFLRIDPDDADEQNLVSSSVVSYGEEGGDQDPQLLASYRRAAGAYPGFTRVEPYYQKMEHLTEIEQRDQWEYRLNLHPGEVHQLMLAIWEMQDLRFDFYFFDENSAYRMLALLDIARPSLRLVEQLSRHRALPLDSLRLVAHSEVVERVSYRPSQAKATAYAVSQLSEKQVDSVDALLLEPWSRAFLNDDYWLETRLTPPEIVAVLETTYDLNRYRVINERLPREPYAAFSYNLVKARSQYSATYVRPTVPEPPRDDAGHLPFRLTLGGGVRGEREFMAFEVRPAYHSLADPGLGYRMGAHLEFMTLALRGYDSFRDVEVEHLKLLEMISMIPKDHFFDPLSWQVGLGARRAFETRESRPLVPYLEAGVGPSWLLGNHLFGFLFKAEGEPSIQLPDGGRLEGGIELNWVYRQEAFRGLLSANQRADVFQKGLLRTRIMGEFYYEIRPWVSIGIKGRYDDSGNDDASEGAVVSQFFF